MSFSSLHPFCKLGLWVLLVVAVSAMIQSVAWSLGLDFNILHKGNGGRGALLAVAIAGLLFVMAADRRPIADYGLSVGPKWKKRWFGGIAVGVLTYVAYVLVAWSLGAYSLRTEPIAASRWLKAIVSAMPSMPLAVTQQIVISGYILSMLRDRCPRAIAVALSAALFAVVHQMDEPEFLRRVDSQQLMVGLFLVAALLGVIRLRTGNIVTSSGLLAGWLIARKLLHKTALFRPHLDSPWYDLLAPTNDPRSAPVMFVVLAVAIGVGAWLLYRHGEGQPPASPSGFNADFKRVFPFSHTNGLAPLDVWFSLLVAARFRVGLKYLPRMAAALIVSAVNTLLSLPERLMLPHLLSNRSLHGPIFVVGTHRSGTTHLHNLLSLDPQFSTARNYQMMNPVGFVLSGWLITPLLGLFMPWKRPMDGVRFGMFSAQEEEFGMAGSCAMSPHWGMTFPQRWPDFERYIFPDKLPEAEQAAWRRQYTLLLRKLSFWRRRRLLLKNPYNTARVALLSRMFPDAKFVHICRHPHVVYRSNLHLAREGHVCNQLQDPDSASNYETRFLDNYREMEQAFARDALHLSADQVARVRFEDLERDTIAVVRRIYRQLKLEFSDEFQQRLQRYLTRLQDYQKNQHRPLTFAEQRMVDETMGVFMRRWGYHEQPMSTGVDQRAA